MTYKNYELFMEEIIEVSQLHAKNIIQQIKDLYFCGYDWDTIKRKEKPLRRQLNLLRNVLCETNKNSGIWKLRQSLRWDELITKYGLDDYREEINNGTTPFITN